MATDGRPDVDAVLTTRELARMIRMRGLDMGVLAPEAADSPLGSRSAAGKLFGATGGVMEAALRTAHFMLTGKELDGLKVSDVRGLRGVKEAKIRIGRMTLRVAVVSGLANARRLLEEVRNGWKEFHFIEVMACPGGCIAGGGQPIGTGTAAVRARMNALYTIDRDDLVRTAHGNEGVRQLYDEFLGKPLGEMSHKLLHTTYAKREVVI
jgi:NADP-reducing hydrogenase subunit HndD